MTGMQQLMYSFTATGARVQVNDAAYSASAFSPDDATITLSLLSTGELQFKVNTLPATTDYNWKLSGAGSDYDVMATIISGTVTTGTTGSWLNLGTSRTWTKTRTNNAAGTDIVTLTVAIRDAVSLVTLDSATIELDAIVEL